MDETCSLRVTRRFDAPPGEVWSALRDLRAWLAPPDGVTVATEEAERLLELDWRPDGEPPSTVRLELHVEGTRTVLVLEHSRIEAIRGMRYMREWMRAVQRLEAPR